MKKRNKERIPGIHHKKGHADGEKLKVIIPVRSVFYGKRGSLTIESALVLPLFLFGMLCLMSFFDLLNYYITLDQAMYSRARLMAQKAVCSYVSNKDQLYNGITELMDEKILKNAPVQGGGYALNVSESDLSNREILVLDAKYTSALPFDTAGLFSETFDHRLIMHTFTGFDLGLYGYTKGTSPEYVYMTENGSVYHTDPGCTHIRLRIREVTKNDIGSLRNNNGGKYKPCEHCHACLTDGILYITPEGDRYHVSLTCSGLKRTVKTVKLSDIPGVPPCLRCKGRQP
ncbi:MAG: pilus assembly protein [Lachnospiraceae bacterium]|nr:pilus assembly protein [Lachnospiraceae bacterium]